jgi:hypothetical protein
MLTITSPLRAVGMEMGATSRWRFTIDEEITGRPASSPLTHGFPNPSNRHP